MLRSAQHRGRAVRRCRETPSTGPASGWHATDYGLIADCQFWYTLKAMERARFERLVRQALDELPGEISSRMENVDVVVEEAPSRDQLIGSGLDEDESLLGLYEGIPLPDRYDYNLVLPDKITLFKATIESVCPSDEDVVREVRDTVVHEVAHHFGIGDDELDALGAS